MLSQAERQYSASKREEAFCIWGCERLIYYLHGRRFSLVIDKQAIGHHPFDFGPTDYNVTTMTSSIDRTVCLNVIADCSLRAADESLLMIIRSAGRRRRRWICTDHLPQCGPALRISGHSHDVGHRLRHQRSAIGHYGQRAYRNYIRTQCCATSCRWHAIEDIYVLRNCRVATPASLRCHIYWICLMRDTQQESPA